MYARELSTLLRNALAAPGAYDNAQRTFESLRGFALLPGGREKAGVRLTDEPIASAIFGFAHTLPDRSGQASLILGKLCVVGGPRACVRGSSTLLHTVETVLADKTACSAVVNIALSIAREDHGERVLH